MVTRYMAKRITTGDWVDKDIPYLVPTSGPTWELNGSGSFQFTIPRAMATRTAQDARPLFDPWGTYVFVETDGVLDWAGIVVSSSWSGQAWMVECAGVLAIPSSRVLLVSDSPNSIEIDHPARYQDVLTPIAQLAYANTGVVWDQFDTAARLAASADDVYSFSYWDAPNLGTEFNNLLADTQMEVREEVSWNADKSDAVISLVYGSPRLGDRRTNLRFAVDENITELVTPELDGDYYANQVVAIGAGDGPATLTYETDPADTWTNIRKTHVLQAKDVTWKWRLGRMARAELRRRQSGMSIPSITVMDHPNAPMGSWTIGDDIRIDADIPNLGKISLWHRITSWERLTATTARLTLQLSDTFDYGE